MKKAGLLICCALCLSALNAEIINQNPEFIVQTGHFGGINKAIFSPDEKFILSSSKDGTVKIWDVASGKEIRTISVNNIKLLTAAGSPDGKYIITSADDNAVRLFDAANGRCLKVFPITEKVSDAEFSPDNKTFYTVTWSAERLAYDMMYRDIADGNLIKTVQGKPGSQYQSVDGSMIFRKVNDTGLGRDLDKWDLISTVNGKKIRRYSISDIVFNLKFSPDGRFFLSSDSDGKGKNRLLLREISSGKTVQTFSGHDMHQIIWSICFSADGSRIISGSDDSTFRLWDVKSGRELKKFTARSWANPAVKVTPDGKNIISSQGNIIIRDIASGKVSTVIKDKKAVGREHLAYSRDGRFFLLADYHTASLYDAASFKLISEIKVPNVRSIDSLDISPDGKRMVVGHRNTVQLHELPSGKVIYTKERGKDSADVNKKVAFTPDGKQILIGDTWITLIEADTGNELLSLSWTVLGVSGIYSMSFSPDGRHVVIASRGNAHSKQQKDYLYERFEVTKTVMLLDISNPSVNNGKQGDEKKRVIRFFEGHGRFVKSIAFSPDGKQILSGCDDASIKLWDTASGRELRTFNGHKGSVTSITFTPDGKYGVSTADDGTMRLWNLSTGEWTAYLTGIGADENKWLIYTADGYWDGSPDCGDLVGMVRGMECWNIEQFAARNNRPDIIVSRLGGEAARIEHYRALWNKRLTRMGLTPGGLSADYETPSSAIKSVSQNGKFADLEISFSSKSIGLKSYQLYINGVPILPSAGKPLTGGTASVREKAELTNGTNKIEASCIDNSGAESFRAVHNIDWNGTAPSDLYILAFGVSKYRNESINLKYADKDAADISAVFSRLKGRKFTNVYSRILTNEQVTPKAIADAKSFLKTAKADDTFVLFIAGHGVHDTDKEATYYYITHTTDAADLPGSAAAFESIENLLRDIEPRKKLFLMDTCESGETEETASDALFLSAEKRGMKPRTSKRAFSIKGKNTASSGKRSFLYEKDRYILNDLVRRTGSIVFSSSRGGEFSYESDTIKNGYFTKEIIRGIGERKADADKDGLITVDELRIYVAGEVSKSTEGLQNPTVDRDNISQKFGFPVPGK